MKVKKLTKKQIDTFLKKYPDWSLNKSETKLTAALNFNKHVEAMVFLARLTVHVEVLNHHPDVLFTFKQLKITTTTHDIDDLSNRDVELIKRIEHLRSGGGE